MARSRTARSLAYKPTELHHVTIGSGQHIRAEEANEELVLKHPALSPFCSRVFCAPPRLSSSLDAYSFAHRQCSRDMDQGSNPPCSTEASPCFPEWLHHHLNSPCVRTCLLTIF
ncbi:uncharacterized protein LOC144134477 [Amblyomma americanum]